MRKVFSTVCVIGVVIMFILVNGIAMADEKVSGKINPAQMPLVFPNIMKIPIEISGSGFQAGEVIIADLMVPSEVIIPGVEPGEPVGLVFAVADNRGDFKGKVDASSKLNFLFRVKWGTGMKPDFRTLKPIPPGKYKIRVLGMGSGRVAILIWEIQPPPAKKK